MIFEVHWRTISSHWFEYHPPIWMLWHSAQNMRKSWFDDGEIGKKEGRLEREIKYVIDDVWLLRRWIQVSQGLSLQDCLVGRRGWIRRHWILFGWKGIDFRDHWRQFRWMDDDIESVLLLWSEYSVASKALRNSRGSRIRLEDATRVLRVMQSPGVTSIMPPGFSQIRRAPIGGRWFVHESEYATPPGPSNKFPNQNFPSSVPFTGHGRKDIITEITFNL
jgi:hypothetical protein